MKKKKKYFLLLLPFLCLVLFFELIPLIRMIISSFMPKNTIGFTLEHYHTIFTKPLYRTAMKNSLVVSVFSSIVGMLLAIVGGIALQNLGEKSKLKKFCFTVLNVVSNFAGVPLAFAYMILLGNSGILVQIGTTYGLDFLANFNLYSGSGLRMMYVYFQIPLATLLLLPAFLGLQKEWEEGAYLLGANHLYYWRKVGIPLLLPSILSTLTVLFANSLAAYATAYALLMNNFALLPISISGMFVGDVIQQKEMGGALSVVLMLFMIVALLVNNYLTKKTSEWKERV